MCTVKNNHFEIIAVVLFASGKYSQSHCLDRKYVVYMFFIILFIILYTLQIK